jgi:hypothetical protein
MTSAERQAETDELIVESERLRAQLIVSIERLETFVTALQTEVQRRQDARKAP